MEPTWPVGQAVKTPPFHGGISGSNPLPVTIFFFGRLAQLGERLPYKQNVSGSIPLAPTNLRQKRGTGGDLSFLFLQKNVYIALRIYFAPALCYNLKQNRSYSDKVE